MSAEPATRSAPTHRAHLSPPGARATCARWTAAALVLLWAGVTHAVPRPKRARPAKSRVQPRGEPSGRAATKGPRGRLLRGHGDTAAGPADTADVLRPRATRGQLWVETRPAGARRSEPTQVWRYDGRRWSRVPGTATRLRGCLDGSAHYTDAPGALHHRGSVRRGTRVSVQAPGSARPLTASLGRLGQPLLWSCDRRGVTVRDVRYHGTGLYRAGAKGVRKVQAGGGATGKGRGVTGHDTHPSGARVWTHMPLMGDRSESASFADYFPKNPGALWYADAAGRRRRLLKRVHAFRPRLVAGGKVVVFWSAGTRTGDRRTWTLNAVDVAAKRATPRALLTQVRVGVRSRMPGTLHARAQSAYVVAPRRVERVGRGLRTERVVIHVETGATRSLGVDEGVLVGAPVLHGDTVHWWTAERGDRRTATGGSAAGSQGAGGARARAPKHALLLRRLAGAGPPTTLLTLTTSSGQQAARWRTAVAAWRPWLGRALWATPGLQGATTWTLVDLSAGRVAQRPLTGAAVAPAPLPPGDVRSHGGSPGRAALVSWDAARRLLNVTALSVNLLNVKPEDGARTLKGGARPAGDVAQLPPLPTAAGAPVRALVW